MFGKFMKGTASFKRVFFLILATGVFLFGCGKGKNSSDEEGSSSDSTATADSSADSTAAADSAEDREAAAVPVEISPVLRGDVHDYILQNATVDTEEGVDVHARVTGLIVKLNVEEGDLVARRCYAGWRMMIIAWPGTKRRSIMTNSVRITIAWKICTRSN